MRLVVIAMLLAGACVDSGPGPAPRIDAKYAREHLLAKEPTDIDRFDVALGDAVIYLGNKLDRTRVVPGQTLTITHYWKVLKPLGKSWRPFALVRGPAGTADFMNLEATDMQIAHPVDTWKPGEIIEDIQPITMRPDWTSSSAVVSIGLIAVGKHGTLDRMAVTGARTHDRAIVAATLDVDLSRAPPPAGTVHVPHAAGPIQIDGMAIDPGWASGATSPELVTAEGSPEPNGRATAKLTWDEQSLYVFLSVVDTDIVSPYKNHDDPLWKADAVELFIDADGNRRGYVELQVNPNNATFDSWFPGPRAPAGDVAWDSQMNTQVKVRGTTEPNDQDQGWEVEIAIPWAAVKGRDEQMPITIPPRVGDRWKLNVVRVDFKSGSDKPSASSWNRIGYGDWHALDRMLVVVFADSTGSIVPSSAAEPGAGSGAAQGSGAGSGAMQGSGVVPTIQQGSGAMGSGAGVVPTLHSSAMQGSSSMQGSGSAAMQGSGATGSAGRALPEMPQRGTGVTPQGSGASGSAMPQRGQGSGASGSAMPQRGAGVTPQGSGASGSAMPQRGQGSGASGSAMPQRGAGVTPQSSGATSGSAVAGSGTTSAPQRSGATATRGSGATSALGSAAAGSGSARGSAAGSGARGSGARGSGAPTP